MDETAAWRHEHRQSKLAYRLPKLWDPFLAQLPRGVADYPLDLKRQMVAEVMERKIQVLATVRAERKRDKMRHAAATRIQRAFRRRPKGVDHITNNKTALGLRP